MNKAFSLIELIVVIAIVGILSAIAVPAYQNYSYKVKVFKGVNQVQNILDPIILKSLSTGTDVPFIENTTPSGNVYGYGLGGDNSACRLGSYTAYIYNYAPGPNVLETGDEGRAIVYVHFLIESPSKEIQQYCVYYEIVDGALGADPGFLPNCSYGLAVTPDIEAAIDACL